MIDYDFLQKIKDVHCASLTKNKGGVQGEPWFPLKEGS